MKIAIRGFLRRITALLLCASLLAGTAVLNGTGRAAASSGGVKVSGCSLTVSEGALGFNLYISGLTDAQAKNGKVVVDGKTHTLSARLSDGTFKVTHFVDAKDVVRKLAITVYSGQTRIPLTNSGAVNGTFSYAVKDYLSEIENGTDEIAKLAKAIDDYGTCAYYYFSGAKDIPVTVADADLSAYRLSMTGTLPDCVHYYGSSLVLNDTISIRHYYLVTDYIDSYTLTVDGKAAEFYPTDTLGLVYSEISGIRAWDIDHAYVSACTTLGKASSLTYSVLSYAYDASGSNSEAPLCKLVRSIYWYNVACKACLESMGATDTSDYMNSKYTVDMPVAVIVRPVNATAEEVYAAWLLQKYIEAEDGYKPSIISDSVKQGSKGFEISVGNTNRPHGKAAYTSDGSYSIKSYTNGISLTGVGQLGLMHGAMRFLEALGGYYYLSWNDLYRTNQSHFKYEPSGISIDYERAFLFTDMDVCFSSINPGRDLTDPYYGKTKPAGYELPKTGRLFSLAFGLNGFYANTYCLPTSEAGQTSWYLSGYENAQYDYPKTVKGLAAGQAHTLLAEFLPAKDYFEDHPEWYAAHVWQDREELLKPDSERQRTPDQLCPYMLLHDREAYNLLLEHCRQIIKKSYDPDAPIQIISISKNDGGDLCMCSNCMKERINHKDTGGMHEAIEYVLLLNKISEDLHKNGAYPNLYIDMLAYEWTVEAPTDIVCDDHVIVRFAPIRRCYGCNLDSKDPVTHVGHVTNQKYYEELVKWTKCCKHVWIWDYNSNFRTTVAPYANVTVMQHDIKLYKELGVEGVYLQSNSRHLESNSEFGDIRNYIEGRMLQDPTRDYEQELAFVTDTLYGKAGVYVREYMKHMEQQASYHHKITAWRDDVNKYDTGLYGTYAGVREKDGGEHTFRMPDTEIGICEGLWKEINRIAESESAEVRTRLTRLEFSWRLVKSTLNVYEFGDPSTYKAANETLIADMKAAGISYFAAINGVQMTGCKYPGHHPDYWARDEENFIGTFTATNPNAERKPSIPEELFVYYKKAQ